MIQFNLLPDVKLEFIKTRKAKRIVTSISTIAAAAAVFILLIAVFFVYGVQKKSIRDLNSDITKYTAQINQAPDLNKILTIQNQLNSLPRLESQKPATQRLFTYLTQLTPNTATISQLSLSFSADSISLTGQADSLATVDQFVDTLKFTTYTLGSSTQTSPAFSNVVLTSFGIGNTGQNTEDSYVISTNFSPTIFNANENVTVKVPDIISTRSETDQPTALFKQAPSSGTAGSNKSQ
jgi:Tfp pilus assembly protein PilN